MLALLPALLMALTQPVWSRVDEAQHTDFIIQLSHGIYPLADRTVIDPETLQIMEQTHVYRFDAPGTYPTPDASVIGPPPTAMSPRANAVWMSRHLWQLSYESAQTPGYYLLMVPLWWVADRIGGTVTAIYAMRVINALLIALLAPLAVIVASRLAPGRSEIAFMAALFAALLPGVALNMTRAGNDALAAVVGGTVVVMATTWAGGMWTMRRASLLGVALGAGVLVKLTLLGLAPAVAVAMLWPAQGLAWQRRVVLLAVTGTLAALCLGIWFAINLHLYGVPIPSARTNRLSIVPPMQFEWRYVPFTIAFFVVSYWSGEPLGTLPLAAAFVVLGCLVVVVATAGWLRVRTPAGPALVGATAIAGMLAFALLLPATAAFQFAGPGRYLYPALPAVAALIAIGLTAALPRAFAHRSLAGVYGIAAVAILMSGAIGIGAEASPSGPGFPTSRFDDVPVKAGAQLGSLSITVERLALDNANHVTWLAISVSNGGRDLAEWNPVPIVSAHGATASGVYSRSIGPLGGEIYPGASAAGWIYVPIEIDRGQSVEVRFLDVALDRYQTVSDVVIQFST